MVPAWRLQQRLAKHASVFGRLAVFARLLCGVFLLTPAMPILAATSGVTDGLADRLPAGATTLRRLACLLDEINNTTGAQGELQTAINLLRSSGGQAQLVRNLRRLRPALVRDDVQRHYRPTLVGQQR